MLIKPGYSGLRASWGLEVAVMAGAYSSMTTQLYSQTKSFEEILSNMWLRP
jgi:hypothetical protein